MFAETFWTNPQYRINIAEPDDDDEDGLSGIIVGVMQKHRRRMKKEGKDNNTIGYAIYKVQLNGLDQSRAISWLSHVFLFV